MLQGGSGRSIVLSLIPCTERAAVEREMTERDDNSRTACVVVVLRREVEERRVTRG